jgi:predicted nuclease of predicted toxin-antitoxin system
MTIWLDAHISPALAPHIAESFGTDCVALRDLGLRDAEDSEIFFKCRDANAILFTKDRDFVDLVARHGPPPQVLWIRIGNCSNEELRRMLERSFAQAVELFSSGSPIVELV